MRDFDFSRITPHPSRSDIKASLMWWALEMKRLGLPTP